MRTLPMLGVVAVCVPLCSGCTDTSPRRVVDTHDVISPQEPQDVHSVTGDGSVTVYWSRPSAADLAGFAVFISQDDATYYLVSEVGASRRHFTLEGDVIPARVPFDFVNGNTYFLGVTAFDWAGNESELTASSTTFDTPRPSGRGLVLYDIAGARASESGYDFSRSPYGYAMPGNDLFADVYLAFEAGRPVLRTAHPEVVEIQDMGALAFDDDAVGWLSDADWNPVASTELRLAHVYVLKIYEETRPGNTIEPFNVAKIQVVGHGADWVSLDWAYQIAPNNPELKPGLVARVENHGTREVLR